VLKQLLPLLAETATRVAMTKKMNDTIWMELLKSTRQMRGAGSKQVIIAEDDPVWRERLEGEQAQYMKWQAKYNPPAAQRLNAATRRPEPRLAELCKGLSTEDGGWKKALRDPKAAAAMRALRQRVRQLEQGEYNSQWAYQVLNRSTLGMDQQRLSHNNPLAPVLSYPSQSKDGLRHRVDQRVPLPNLTGLWCDSFEVHAHPEAVDFEWRYATGGTTADQKAGELATRAAERPQSAFGGPERMPVPLKRRPESAQFAR